MKRTILAVLFITLASSSYAFELQTLKPADLKTAEIAVPAPAPAPSAVKQYQNLWMSVHANPSWREASAYDSRARIDLRVRKVFDTSFNADIRVEGKGEYVSLNKYGGSFSLYGSGISLNMNEWGGNYGISGNVRGEDNQTRYVNLTLYKGFDDYSFSVNGMGLNLNINRMSISGNYDDTRYSKKAVAAIVTLALAAQVDKMPARKSAQKNTERIWLTIRNSQMGWNTVEAYDPFSRITVGLRKVFDTRYDAEIEVDNEREFGSVDHFFSRTYEYRDSRSDLRLEEWAGSYRLQGNLYVRGHDPEMIRVDLNLRGYFEPGSFAVNEPGLRLTADRYGVNAEVDTALYPKKLVAVIAALAMEMQQEIPQPR